MTPAPSILVFSSCTARKATTDAADAVPAEELYTGQQHLRLMRGVWAYRSAGERAGALDLRILSARHGVIAANTPITSYDATFAGMAQPELRAHSSRLEVPGDVARLLSAPRQLTILLLGERYLRAADLATSLALGAPTIAFVSPRAARRLPRLPHLHPITLDNRDATRFSCGLIALKGELTARLLTGLAGDPSARVPLDRPGLLTSLEAVPAGVEGNADLSRAA